MESNEQVGGAARPQGLQSQYPSGVGTKFDVHGSVRPFPGNTIISHLDRVGELYGALLALYEQLKVHPLSHLYSLLPPTSWHMTVFEGVVDDVRAPGFWPSDLANDVVLDDCDELFARKLAHFDMKVLPPFILRIGGWQPLENGIALQLQADSSRGETELRELRDRLADLLQIRHPGHETYTFHLSIAYLIRYPSPEEVAILWTCLDYARQTMPLTFELGAPEFCKFRDMFEFQRQFYLKTRC